MRGLPVMPKFIGPEEARKQARQHSVNIFKCYDTLRGILERHEATIQKRWMKKGKEQRRKLITASWGKPMAKLHRPDFQAFRTEGTPKKQGETKHRDAYVWPFINEEDLTKPRSLLFFLNARGRNSPDRFAASDMEAMRFGIVAKAVVPLFLNEHVMVFRGRHDPRKYGELVNWEEVPEAFWWSQTRKELLPGEGLLVLESQEKTMDFLVKCAKEILHDIDKPLDREVQPAPPPVVEAGTGFDSLVVMAAEAPYRLPAQLSFDRIESLLSAKRNASSDHLWSLREDPGYFADCIMEAKEHRQELMIDSRGLAHPIFRSGKDHIFWARVVNRVIADAHLGFELWAELHKQSIELGKMKKQYEDQIDPEKDLPEPYLDALLKFQHYLHRAVDLPLGGLKMAHAASPPLRHLYCRDPEDDPMMQKTSYGTKPGARPDETTKHLTWLFRQLGDDDNTLSLSTISKTADELQRMMDDEPKTKNLVSPYLAAYISDFSIVAECVRQIEIYHPWANTFEHYAAEKHEAIESEYEKTGEPWRRLLLSLKNSETALGRYAVMDGRFDYPVDKRKTEENNKTMQSAEQALDTFWTKVDELLSLNIKNLDGLAIKDLLTTRRLQRTPDWVESTKSSKTVEVKEFTKPLSEIYFDLQLRTERTQEKSTTSGPPKSKQKTRGTAAPQPESNVIAEEANSIDTQPTFEVDQRALKVFKTLFYTPSVTVTPGEVVWTDFLHALSSVGFRSEKLYGSVWQFSPTKLDVERSIQFHEPHPSGKVPYRTARRHGRRLNRAYGWHGGMFTLIEKTQKSAAWDGIHERDAGTRT